MKSIKRICAIFLVLSLVVTSAFSSAVILAQNSTLMGDVNYDGRVNLKDLLRYKKYLAKFEVPFTSENADFNGDGLYDAEDIVLLKRHILLSPINEQCNHIYTNDTPLASRCIFCGELEENYMPKSIKILAIGNSFSDDATEHLWNILHDAGVEEIIVANMYIGGCSIDTHYYNVTNDLGAYEYRKNTSGYIVNTSGTKISTALADEDWDIVTMQQASGYSGKPDSYSNLTSLISYVRNRVSAECKFYWQMTWAYQYGYSGLSNYSNDQMTMYNAICSTVNEKVIPLGKYEDIIPSGTAVQNLRTSYFGDTLTRDGYHMSFDYGRYLVGLTWYATLGGNLDLIDWVPNATMSYDLPAIKEAVSNALANRYSVTNSSYLTPPELTDEQLLASHGKNIKYYSQLNLDQTAGGYWNSTDSTNHSVLVTQAGNSPYFIGTKTFTKAELPVGSVIIIDNGYQYRPEGWYVFGQQNTTYRPDNTSAKSVVVDDAWWGGFTRRAFNISKTSGAIVSDSDFSAFRIYVPNTELGDSEIFESIGKDINSYAALSLSETVGAFWDSTESVKHSKLITDSGLSINFVGSKTFTRDELPVGSVIIVDSGYRYRPDGWLIFGQQNTSVRPDNVSVGCVIVDDAWWGSYTVRGFNISKTSGGTATSDYIGKLRIYVPKTDHIDSDAFLSLGKDITDYKAVYLNEKIGAYWNSTDSVNHSTLVTWADNSSNFIATKTFTKDELPVGSVIIVDAGYQYRPDGWTVFGQQNTTLRPGNVSSSCVIDDAWWGTYNARGFNVSKISGGTVTSSDLGSLRVYIPK